MVPEVGHGVKALPEVVVGVLGVGKIEILYCYNGQDLFYRRYQNSERASAYAGSSLILSYNFKITRLL